MADNPPATGPDQIDDLIRQVAGEAGSPGSGAAGSTGPASSAATLGESEVESLLNRAEEAIASINGPAAGGAQPPVVPFRLQDFASTPSSADGATIDLVRDVELDLKIELGRTQMYLEDVLKLRKGSVVPLDKLAGDPVDVYVNGRLIARGEVLVLNDNFCVRVAELVATENSA